MFIGLKPLKSLFPIKTMYSLAGLFGLSLLSFIIFSPYIPYNIKLQAGDTAHHTITAPRFVEFESNADKLQTDYLRKQRGELVNQAFSINIDINKDILASIITVFTEIKAAQTKKDPSVLLEKVPFLTPKLSRHALSMSPQSLASIEYSCLKITENLLLFGVKDIDKNTLRPNLLNHIAPLLLPRLTEQFILTILEHLITPNYVYNASKTKANIDAAMATIPPFKTTLKEGTPILYKGETVQEKHVETLKALHIYGRTATIKKFLGLFLYSLLLFILFERFLYFFKPSLHKKPSKYIAIFTVALLVLIIGRLLLNVNPNPSIINLKYLIPIPLITMTVSLLVSHNIAMLTGCIVSIMIALMYNGDFSLFLFLFLSNSTATFASFKVSTRTELIKTGNVIGFFNIQFILAIGFLNDTGTILWFVWNSSIAFCNGLLSAMITLAILPYLEGVFRFTTSLSLLEQANLNHPLLRRMMVTAPGTYQHSLMVATLAEAAADAVNADGTLTRIGAYFHDIGKMKRPTFFIENQFNKENPHNALSPRMSKIIIAAHPKDGLEMAIKYKLPKILHAFIMQHHGTSLVSFFYTQAVKNEEPEITPELEESFRYPGPKPQFREAGIIMLADSVEAAVRSMNKATLPKIENLINKIFKNKIIDTQLDDCPLTLKELEKIKITFLKVFKGIYHNRLDYQEEISQTISLQKEKKL